MGFPFMASESDLNKSIILAGWVHRKRDHGGISFLDLRDRSGLVQIVVEPENVELAKIGNNLRNEWVVQVKGIVRTRPIGTENLELPTGKYEVLVEEINILSESETPPFYINEEQYEKWKHTDLTIDAVKGIGGMFSLDNGTGKRFLTKSEICVVVDNGKKKTN